MHYTNRQDAMPINKIWPKVLYVIVIFLFLYQPPIFRINVLHVIGAISLLYLACNRSKIHKYFNTHRILMIYFCLIFQLVYLLVIVVCWNSEMSNIASPVYMMADVLPFVIAITLHQKKHRLNTKNLINAVLMAGSIQAAFSIAAFLYPAAQRLFIAALVNYGYEDVLFELSSFRVYGFSANLTYSDPIAQSILGAIAIYCAVKRNWKYILYAPALFFSAIINARISIVVFFLGILLILFQQKKGNYKEKASWRLLIYGAVFAVLAYSLIIPYIKVHSQETYTWIKDGYEEIVSFVKGDEKEYSYFNYLQNKQRVRLPTGFSLFFGTGVTVMGGSKYGVYSDIGYVNDIWLGGVVYAAFLYVFWIIMLRDIQKDSGSMHGSFRKYIFLLFSATLILSNIKGIVLIMNSITNLFFVFYAHLALDRSQSELQLEFNDKQGG